jgi:hypothetical protein
VLNRCSRRIMGLMIAPVIRQVDTPRARSGEDAGASLLKQARPTQALRARGRCAASSIAPTVSRGSPTSLAGAAVSANPCPAPGRVEMARARGCAAGWRTDGPARHPVVVDQLKRRGGQAAPRQWPWRQRCSHREPRIRPRVRACAGLERSTLSADRRCWAGTGLRRHSSSREAPA